jgi:hypothetical protein
MHTTLRSSLPVGCLVGLLALTSGCASTTGKTSSNPQQPGPAIGQAVGTAVGVVAGNVVGAAVGTVEGTANGLQKPLTNDVRVIRTWHTETTPDGRTIQVPTDTAVDQYGRPLPLQ